MYVCLHDIHSMSIFLRLEDGGGEGGGGGKGGR